MSRPFMPFYDGDWLRDTAHLSDAQERAYFRLVLFYWANGELPIDDKQLSRIAHCTPFKWKNNRKIISRFFSHNWVHKRIEKELEKCEKFSQKQRSNVTKRYTKQLPNSYQTATRARVPQPHKEKEKEKTAASPSPANGGLAASTPNHAPWFARLCEELRAESPAQIGQGQPLGGDAKAWPDYSNPPVVSPRLHAKLRDKTLQPDGT